jgi:predicted phage-related endonuclease
MPKINFETRDEWLQERSFGLGGSDIAAIIGKDDYRTPLDVYLDKTGQSNKVFTDEQQANMDRGHILEKPLLEWLRLQNVAGDFEHNTSLYIDDNDSIYRCTPDGIGENVIIEAKSTSLFIDEVLPKWFIQGQWNLGVTGKEFLYIVWINGRLKFQYSRYRRDNELIEFLQKTAKDFWNNNILTRTPPNAVNSKDIQKLFERHVEGKAVELSLEQYSIFNDLVSIKDKIKALENNEEELSEKIKMIMQDSESLTYGGKVIASWKSTESNRFDTTSFKKIMPELYHQFTKPSISRRFLIK